jgi:phosphoribosylaminoimidazole-succinocarboxamide synthase
MRELLYKGSTKDIYHVSGEELMFKFSNRYSIFDYGEMPDQIELKGKNTALFTFNIYKYFESKLGIKTHLLRLGPEADEIIVRKFNVPRDFDSSTFYQRRPVNAFIPLEVIFRFGAPKGSSLIKKGFKEGEKFESVMIDFTTKLESIDRPIDLAEAKEISGMNENEFTSLQKMANNLAYSLRDLIESKGLTLWDGKFEFAFGETISTNEREIILVDSISLDEMRISYKEMPLSKEILRQIYKNDPWFKELSEIKEVDRDNFRSKVSKPKNLDAHTMQLISDMYGEVQGLLISKNSSESNLEKLDNIILELKNEHNCLR